MDSSNIWGTTAGGIEVAVKSALAERKATHGGILVEQVNTNSDKVFRARDGWVLELCENSIHISLIGSSLTREVPICFFRHAGEEAATERELIAANIDDRRACRSKMAELVARHRTSGVYACVRPTAKDVDSEFDATFARLTDYTDAPHIEYTPAKGAE